MQILKSLVTFFLCMGYITAASDYPDYLRDPAADKQIRERMEYLQQLSGERQTFPGMEEPTPQPELLPLIAMNALIQEAHTSESLRTCLSSRLRFILNGGFGWRTVTPQEFENRKRVYVESVTSLVCVYADEVEQTFNRIYDTTQGGASAVTYWNLVKDVHETTKKIIPTTDEIMKSHLHSSMFTRKTIDVPTPYTEQIENVISQMFWIFSRSIIGDDRIDPEMRMGYVNGLLMVDGGDLGKYIGAAQALIEYDQLSLDNRVRLATDLLRRGFGLGSHLQKALSFIGNDLIEISWRTSLAEGFLSEKIELGSQLSTILSFVDNEDVCINGRVSLTIALLDSGINLREKVKPACLLICNSQVGSFWRMCLVRSLLRAGVVLEGEQLDVALQLMSDEQISLDERTRLAADFIYEKVNLGPHLKTALSFLSNELVSPDSRAGLAQAVTMKKIDLDETQIKTIRILLEDASIYGNYRAHLVSWFLESGKKLDDSLVKIALSLINDGRINANSRTILARELIDSKEIDIKDPVITQSLIPMALSFIGDTQVHPDNRTSLVGSLMERDISLGKKLEAARDLFENREVSPCSKSNLACDFLERDIPLGKLLENIRALLGNKEVHPCNRINLACDFLWKKIPLGAQLDAVLALFDEGDAADRIDLACSFLCAKEDLGARLKTVCDYLNNDQIPQKGRSFLAYVLLKRKIPLGDRLAVAQSLAGNIDPDLKAEIDRRFVA